MILLLATGLGCSACVALPGEIPDSPGKVDEDIVADLLAVSSPDLPINLWLTVSALFYEDFRDCPVVTIQPSVVAITTDADGCLDSAGVHWVGSASVSYGAGGALVFSFEHFGPDDGIDDAWTAFGTVTVSRTTSGVGDRVRTDLQVNSRPTDDARVMYHATDASLAYYDGAAYIDHQYGTVGLGDWGTAEIDGNRVALGTANGCEYAQHYAGTIGVFAANEAAYSFKRVAPLEGPPPPAEGDTGFDTGGDADADTDTDTDTDPDIEADATGPGGEGLCGDCVVVSIDGTALPECVEADRAIGWAFSAPWDTPE